MKKYIPKWVQINIFIIIVFFIFDFVAYADEDNLLSEFPNENGFVGIVNPYNSTCYDWRGNIVPCIFKRQYAELLLDKPVPTFRFIDNKDGTELLWDVGLEGRCSGGKRS